MLGKDKAVRGPSEEISFDRVEGHVYALGLAADPRRGLRHQVTVVEVSAERMLSGTWYPQFDY